MAVNWRVDRWALLHARAELEKADSGLDVHPCDGRLDNITLWGLGPVQVWVVLGSFAVTATVSIGVPSEEQFLGVTIEPAVG